MIKWYCIGCESKHVFFEVALLGLEAGSNDCFCSVDMAIRRDFAVCVQNGVFMVETPSHYNFGLNVLFETLYKTQNVQGSFLDCKRNKCGHMKNIQIEYSKSRKLWTTIFVSVCVPLKKLVRLCGPQLYDIIKNKIKHKTKPVLELPQFEQYGFPKDVLVENGISPQAIFLGFEH